MLPLWWGAYPGTTTDAMAIHFSHKPHDLDPSRSGHGLSFDNQTLSADIEFILRMVILDQITANQVGLTVSEIIIRSGDKLNMICGGKVL